MSIEKLEKALGAMFDDAGHCATDGQFNVIERLREIDVADRMQSAFYSNWINEIREKFDPDEKIWMHRLPDSDTCENNTLIVPLYSIQFIGSPRKGLV
jgi:hypothetical protein